MTCCQCWLLHPCQAKVCLCLVSEQWQVDNVRVGSWKVSVEWTRILTVNLRHTRDMISGGTSESMMDQETIFTCWLLISPGEAQWCVWEWCRCSGVWDVSQCDQEETTDEQLHSAQNNTAQHCRLWQLSRRKGDEWVRKQEERSQLRLCDTPTPSSCPGHPVLAYISCVSQESISSLF